MGGSFLTYPCQFLLNLITDGDVTLKHFVLIFLLNSFVLACCGLLLLVAFEGFGHLNLTFEQAPATSAFLTVSLHPDMNVQEHPALFLVLSTVLSALAWLAVIPLHSLLVCVLYSALFAFISTKAMISWAFPLSLADTSFTHELLAFPFAYVFASKFLLTLVAVWNPRVSALQAKYSSPLTASVTQGALVLACALPFFALLWALSAADDMYARAHAGIEWTAVVGLVTLCSTTRLRELYNDASGKSILHSSIGKGSTYSNNSNSSELSVCVCSATLSIFWVSFAVLSSHNLDRDVLIPLASLTLLCTTPGAIIKNTPPLVVMGGFCSAFWVGSALYAILVKGYDADPALLGTFQQTPTDMFGFDSDVSLWTQESKLWPLLNLLQVQVPLPAIYVGIMGTKGFSEDMLFVLAVISLVPVFAAQIGSLRYLGITGMLFAVWRGYNIGDLQYRSDRLI